MKCTKALVVFVTILALVLSAGFAYAQAPPPLPAIYSGTVKDAGSSPVAAGTVRAYMDGDLKGEKSFQGGAYEHLLVAGGTGMANKPVTFTVVVGGAEYPAISTPDPVNWLSGRMSGLDFPMVNLAVDLSAQVQPEVQVSVQPSTVTLRPGETQQLQVTTNPSGAQISYSSGNTGVATVNSGGLVTTVGEGFATITIMVGKEGYKTGTANVQVQVSDSKVQVGVQPTGLSLKPGETQQLAVTTNPSGAQTSYSSGNTGVATVSSGGLVTAVGRGTAIINVTASRSGYEPGTTYVQVQVSDNKVQLSVQPDSIGLRPGLSRQLQVTADSGAQVTFKSGNPAVAVVNSSGLVIGVDHGTVNITVTAAKSGLETNKVDVQVQVSDSVQVNVQPALVTLKPGETRQLQVTTDPTGVQLSYSSEKTGVTTISSSGRITAVKDGVSVITVTATKSGYTTGTANVMVQVQTAEVLPPAQDQGKTIVLTIGSTSVMVDGVEKQIDAAPFIKIGFNRTLVPIRFLSETLGYTVDWLEETRQVRISERGKTVMLTIGSDVAVSNGKEIYLDCPAEIVNIRTFVPLRFVSEQLGARVHWDDATRTVTITR